MGQEALLRHPPSFSSHKQVCFPNPRPAQPYHVTSNLHSFHLQPWLSRLSGFWLSRHSPGILICQPLPPDCCLPADPSRVSPSPSALDVSHLLSSPSHFQAPNLGFLSPEHPSGPSLLLQLHCSSSSFCPSRNEFT